MTNYTKYDAECEIKMVDASGSIDGSGCRDSDFMDSECDIETEELEGSGVGKIESTCIERCKEFSNDTKTEIVGCMSKPEACFAIKSGAIVGGKNGSTGMCWKFHLGKYFFLRN